MFVPNGRRKKRAEAVLCFLEINHGSDVVVVLLLTTLVRAAAADTVKCH